MSQILRIAASSYAVSCHFILGDQQGHIMGPKTKSKRAGKKSTSTFVLLLVDFFPARFDFTCPWVSENVATYSLPTKIADGNVGPSLGATGTRNLGTRLALRIFCAVSASGRSLLPTEDRDCTS